MNLRRPTHTPYRGVQRRGQRYRAQITLGGQEQILGLYATPEAAARARDAELRRLRVHDIACLHTVQTPEEETCTTRDV